MANVDITKVDEHKNIIGRTAVLVGLRVTGETSHAGCRFIRPPVATPVVTAGPSWTVTLYDTIVTESFRTAPGRPPPATDCDDVDCFVFTMGYQVTTLLNFVIGSLPLGTDSHRIGVWLTSDGRSGFTR